MTLEISKPLDTHEKLTRHILPALKPYNFRTKQFFIERIIWKYYKNISDVWNSKIGTPCVYVCFHKSNRFRAREIEQLSFFKLHSSYTHARNRGTL